MTEPDILTPREAHGCGLVLATLVAFAVATFLLFGCTSYTVLPADREVVPVRQSVTDEATRRRTYVEAEADATGWYVPDSIMLELLEAD